MAEPRPDMNIKVAAFTVSEKSINTNKIMVHTNGEVDLKLMDRYNVFLYNGDM